ncbi:MAG: transposase [Deltaproteobacteria bacterium]|jgi:hypothetical protein|nr:transposase [Deltaproteobacteria bacterium]
MDDCYALVRVRHFIESVIANDSKEYSRKKKEKERNHFLSEVGVKYCKEIKTKSIFHPPIIFSESEFITKCSYFDYQKQRVNVRTDKSLQKKIKFKKRIRKNSLRVNETVKIWEKRCPDCGSDNISATHKIWSKKVIDLKLLKSCVKKWIVRYTTKMYMCGTCGSHHSPIRYRKICYRFGHSLKSWAIYHQVVNRLSARQVQMDFFEQFELVVSHDTINRFMIYFANFYNWTYHLLSKKILTSLAVYADETPLKTKYEDAYAWIFTDNKAVVSFYKDTREGGFLIGYLKDFNNVLITDFYSAYDAIKCKHQKCLIHLMRDFNDALLKNPFNYEFREMAHDFTKLLQRIVKTIDKYGLKHRYLKKHKKGAEQFLDKVAATDYKFDISKQFKTRIVKYRGSLFEFLNHEGISWNNTSAEHAIKLLSVHFNSNIFWYQTSGIKDYLKVLSIYQTCKYNDVSFLKYLVSGERNIFKYIENHYHSPTRR